ncbi:uncharacterized protein LOC125715428 [Brienomyrus brachyistius]|uniref:uncharacterized protein LOC125715428 n=1 Tax=Brienomyrus brachyistius TaxID=42636 RepID=UPI0020B32D93|nr:uncharacterized protein LOC125715428 [Brienomyrus brachyistius]
MSKKWENRTKALVTKWPKGGTWDVAVCGEMETLIKYHKANKNTERRKKKRRKELEVLRLFKVKGETRRRDQKAMRKALSEKEEMRQKEIWPPSYQSQYPLVEAPPPSYKGQFPVIEGKVEFKGEVTQKDQAGSEQKGTASCLDGYREVSALLRQAMEEGLRGSELITEGQVCGSEKKGSAKKVGYGVSGSEVEGLTHLLDTPNPPSKGWSQFQEKETETESEEGVEDRVVRSRRAVRPPTRYTPMLPLMVKGAQTQYVPWAGQDLEGLLLRLPVLAEGAGKWIKAIEEETMGRLLAIGDIKAVMARTLGVDAMERLLRSSGLAAATGTPVNDACPFDGYRANFWHQLRLMFPPRLSVVEMKVEPIKEGESPAAYLQAQEKRWRTESRICRNRHSEVCTGGHCRTHSLSQ